MEIDSYEVKSGYEAIKTVQLKSEKELQKAIEQGEINDGFTLAAYMYYINDKLLKD